jgi:hypothetical protein
MLIMTTVKLNCSKCRREFDKETKYFSYQTKLGTKKFYCSRTCQRQDQRTSQYIPCANCTKLSLKKPSEMNNKNIFCSLSCSVKYNNSHRDRLHLVSKICIKCGKTFNGYCGIPIKFAKCEDCKRIYKRIRTKSNSVIKPYI